MLQEEDVLLSRILLWTPTQGSSASGRPLKTYIDVLKEGTGLQVEDLTNVMKERGGSW